MFRQTRTIAYYTLLEALRNRLAWLIVVVALIGVALSGFLNEVAVTESRQLQMALLAGFLRFSAVFLMATFVVTSMVREANDKGLELLLALPLARAGYLLGKMVGFSLLALLPAMVFGGLTLLLATPLQAGLWTISLSLELWIVAAVSLLCVLTFNQVMLALSAVFGFYLLARSIEALHLIGQAQAGDAQASSTVIKFVIDAIGMVLPHLDAFTRSEWLLYQSGSWNALMPLLGQSAVYLLLLGGVALFDLYRKNI